MRGFGQSPPAVGTFSLAGDLVELLDELELGPATLDRRLARRIGGDGDDDRAPGSRVAPRPRRTGPPRLRDERRDEGGLGRGGGGARARRRRRGGRGQHADVGRRPVAFSGRGRSGRAQEGRGDAAARDRDLSRGGRGGRAPGARRGLGRPARARSRSPRSILVGDLDRPEMLDDRRPGSRPRSRTRAGRRSPARRTCRAWSAPRSSTGSCWSSSRELAGGDRARRPDLGPRLDGLDGDGRGPLARLARRARADARADRRAGGAPARLRAGRPARDGRLEPRAGGDPPHVRRERAARARHDASERDPAPQEAARPRPHAVRRRVEVGHDTRDALSARLLPRPGRRLVRRRSPIPAPSSSSSPASATSSGSSTASRRSAGATRRCPRSGSCRPC